MNSRSKSDPGVSIIVPVKNGVETIRELLESLMRIDYEKGKVEVVVVDGNSTDSTREIVSQFPVKLLVEERPGLNAARNTGIKHSGGEIIVFTDSDCVVPRDWVKRMTENFQDSQVGCVGGSVRGYYDSFLSQYCDESIVPVLRIFRKRKVLHKVNPPLQYPAGCNMAIKREVIEEAGLFDENIKYGFDEDELVERICKKGHKMVLDPEVLVKHKHRLSLKKLLKQTFQYGRGGALLSKIDKIESSFSRWTLEYVLGFAIWISTILSLALFTVFTGSLMSLIMLLTGLLLPPTGLMIFYGYQACRRKDKRIGKILVYPFIDIMRSIAFLAGAIYQLLKRKRQI